MEIIDIETVFVPELGEQATRIVYAKDDGGYKVVIKVGDKTYTEELSA